MTPQQKYQQDLQRPGFLADPAQAMAVAPTPALAAVFCGIEKMPPPTIEPTTRAVSAPRRS